MLERLVDAYPNDVQFVYRHFPLNQIHAHAQKSAEASELAGEQGHFWEYHDILMARQVEWSNLSAGEARDYFIAIATELGLDVAQFTTGYDENKYASYVTAVEQEAIALGMPGTPTAIVNGQLIPSQGLPRDFEVWAEFIEGTIKVKRLEERQYDAPPPLSITPDETYRATVQMADGGEFTIELYPQSAPQTVNSFIFLAEAGWFDGVTFHRVLPGFVAQTGDPSGTGMGGPGYTIPNEIDPNLSHSEVGMVAMANSGPDTNGSQWYITLADVSQLDGNYTIFGRVIEGMDVVEAITPRDPSTNPNAPDGDVIETITIETGSD